MRAYNAIVSIGISELNKDAKILFIQNLSELDWIKIDGLSETWEVHNVCENKDDARFNIMHGVMQAKAESGFPGALKIVIAFDSGRPTFVTLTE